MSSRFLLQTTLLLFLGQLLLGGLGMFLALNLPWVGLPVTLFLFWLIYRLAKVFRAEAANALKRSEPVQPGRLAFFVGLGAQLPGLLLLPFWAPTWITGVWQGALMPASALVSERWPAVGEWLWLAFLLELALFVGVASRPVEVPKVYQAASLKAPAGEWVAARRLADINRRGRRVK